CSAVAPIPPVFGHGSGHASDPHDPQVAGWLSCWSSGSGLCSNSGEGARDAADRQAGTGAGRGHATEPEHQRAYLRS
ncbi:hypothetical protein KR067_005911, partial [Drosophila pandora]